MGKYKQRSKKLRNPGKVSRKQQLAEARQRRLENPPSQEGVESVLGTSCTPSTPQNVPSAAKVSDQKSNNDISSVKSSLRLLDFQKSDIDLQVAEQVPEYQLIDLSVFKASVNALCCPVCSSHVEVVVNKHIGFAANLSYICSGCGEVINSFNTSTFVPGTRKLFDVNRRQVQGFATMGKGFNALEKYSMYMNMTCVTQSNFYTFANKVYKSNKSHGIESLLEARRRVREYHESLDPPLLPGSVIDMAVSYDGTWQKRGFTSNFSAGNVIHIQTGLVMDFCVLSKICHACSLAKIRMKGEETEEFKTWAKDHKPDCMKNYDGSSPNMETHAAEILWRNSLNYKFRYTTILSDGDSKVHSHLSSLDIYGKDVSISKEECVNHVAKRLGTGLRNAVKTAKAQKVTLGGVGHGTLKISTITQLTRYYHNAILANINTDVDSMKKACMATLDHCASTDDNPQHDNCPSGAESWCYFQRALAKREKPPPHAENMRHPLNEVVVQHIRPIYVRLSDAELLKRCMRGATQNANESLHSCIWRICDKNIICSKGKVDYAVAQAIAEFNFGQKDALTSMNKAGISPGRKSVLIAKKKDKLKKKRISARKKLQFQENRRAKKLREIREEEKKKKNEGVTYGAGQF